MLVDTQPGDLLVRSTDTASSVTDAVSVISSITSAAPDARMVASNISTLEVPLVRRIERPPLDDMAGLMFISSYPGIEGVWYCNLPYPR